MAKRDRATYMRDYRARRRDDVQLALEDLDRITPHGGTVYAAQRIQELEEEVRHLKAELAKRSETRPNLAGLGGFNTRPFTPVPKKGK